MSNRKYSAIWLHFETEEGSRARCKHCQASLSLAGGCQSNLKRHLAAKHSIKHLTLDMPESKEVIKFEEPFDDQCLESTEIITDIQQNQLTELISSPTTSKLQIEQKWKRDSAIQKRKYSVIWLHFDDEGGKRARCKYCKATLSFSGGCHGNLRRHIKLKHPLTRLNVEEQMAMRNEELNYEQSIDEDPLTDTPIKVTPHTEEQPPKFRRFSNGKVRKAKTIYFQKMPKGRYSLIWSHFEDEGSHRARCIHCKTTISFAGGCHGNLKRHLRLKHSQTPLNIIKKFREQPTTDPEITADQIDRQLLKMIAKGHHSLSLIEEPEFQKFIHDVSNYPGYALPSKEVLSECLLPNIHMDLLEDVKRKIQSATAVCLTTDEWISTTNVNCLAVTAYYINSDTMLTSHLLAYEEFENRYTAENVCSFLQSVVAYFEIPKVVAIVNNNEPYLVDAIQMSEWRGISCFAHSLNVTVQNATTEISDTINKIRKIVTYFHKNVHVLKEAEIIQKHMNLFESKLKQDVSKKWNSTFEMLQGIDQIKEEVVSILSANQPDLMLSTEEWEIIGETIPILQPFYEVTREISGERNFTLAKVTVLYNLLDKHIAKCLPSNEEVTAMVINLQMSIASCFGSLEKNKLYAESTILDPRFKQKGFRNVSSYEQAVSNLRDKISAIILPDGEDETAACGITNDRNSLWEAYDLEFNTSSATENSAAAGIREFEKYMAEEYLDRRRDPYVWWKERKHLYPRVYAYALKRLCIVASSVSCEKIFSSAGQIINARRSLLEPNKIEGLIFLHHNM